MSALDDLGPVCHTESGEFTILRTIQQQGGRNNTCCPQLLPRIKPNFTALKCLLCRTRWGQDPPLQDCTVLCQARNHRPVTGLPSSSRRPKPDSSHHAVNSICKTRLLRKTGVKDSRLGPAGCGWQDQYCAPAVVSVPVVGNASINNYSMSNFDSTVSYMTRSVENEISTFNIHL